MDDRDEEAGVRKSSRARRAVERYDDAAQKAKKKLVARKRGHVVAKGSKRKRQEENRANKKRKANGKSERGKKIASSAKSKGKANGMSLPKSSFIKTFLSLLSTAQSSLAGDFEPPSKWIEEMCKVPPFRLLKQNLYRAPLCRPAFDEEKDATVCNCSAQGGKCGPDCVNRQLFLECVPGLCPCHSGRFNEQSKPLCDNSTISAQSFPSTKVISTPGRGFGLIVCEDVPAHTIVAEYMGEVLTTDEVAARMANYSGSDHFYFANLGRGLMLDASKMGSLARFANHSCEPNCAMQRWTVLGEPRIVLTAVRDIPANSEITYCYNFEDDGWAHNPIRAQICLCGSRFCSGRVGKAASGSQDQIEKLTAKIQENTSRQKRATLDALTALLAQAKTLDEKANDPALRLAMQALEAFIAEAQAWSQQARDLLASTSLVEVQVLESTLAAMPAGLRSEHHKELSQTLAVHHSATTLLSSLSTQTSIRWESLVEGMRAIQSALPVRVPGAEELLFKYISLLRWCAEEVWPLTSSMKAVSDKLSVTVASASRSSVYSLLQKLAPGYGILPSSIPLDTPTWSADLLDDRLTVYMQVHSTTHQQTTEPLLCFCQLPDDHGDCPLAVQCSACCEWYHLDCMNFPPSSTAAMKKQDVFHCPLCLLGLGMLSHFAFLPESEWSPRSIARVLRTGSSNSAPNQSAEKPKEKGKEKLPGRSKPPSTSLTSITTMTTTTATTEKTSKTKAAIKWKHFVTVEELDKLVSSSRRLVIQDSPVAALLALAQTFLQQWMDRVQQFEAIRLPLLATFLASCLEPETLSSATAMSDREIALWREARDWLRDCLRLYWQLAILRVKPVAQLQSLRLWIWTLAVLPAAMLPLPQREGYDPRLTPTELATISSAGETLWRACTSPLSRSTLSLLAPILQTLQKRLQARRQAVEELLKPPLSLLSGAEQETAQLEGQQESRCETGVMVASKALSQLIDWNAYVAIDHLFAYARLRCWARRRGQALLGEEGREGRYCWCRGEQQGQDMVCCDRCEEWFHCACVGIQEKSTGKGTGQTEMCVTHSWRVQGGIPFERQGEKMAGKSKPNKKVVAERMSQLSAEQYLCISCSDIAGVPYPFAW